MTVVPVDQGSAHRARSIIGPPPAATWPAGDLLFPALRDSAYRVRAQVDVLMPGATVHFGTTRDDAIMESFAREDGITLGEMQRTASNVLRYLLRSGIVERREG